MWNKQVKEDLAQLSDKVGDLELVVDLHENRRLRTFENQEKAIQATYNLISELRREIRQVKTELTCRKTLETNWIEVEHGVFPETGNECRTEVIYLTVVETEDHTVLQELRRYSQKEEEWVWGYDEAPVVKWASPTVAVTNKFKEVSIRRA